MYLEQYDNINTIGMILDLRIYQSYTEDSINEADKWQIEENSSTSEY